jgi:hypothetical protein
MNLVWKPKEMGRHICYDADRPQERTGGEFCALGVIEICRGQITGRIDSLRAEDVCAFPGSSRSWEMGNNFKEAKRRVEGRVFELLKRHDEDMAIWREAKRVQDSTQG